MMRRLQLSVTGNGDRWIIGLQFPLTPALSPRDRENRRQSVGESYVSPMFEGRDALHPLPAGEGRGEGEWIVRQTSTLEMEYRRKVQNSLLFRAFPAPAIAKVS